MRDVGFSEPQAEAVAFVFADTREENARGAVTHEEVGQELKVLRAEVKGDIEAAVHPVKADVLVLKWMVGFLLAGVATLIARSFGI